VSNFRIQLVKRLAVKQEGSRYGADWQLASCRVYRCLRQCHSRSYITPTLLLDAYSVSLLIDRIGARGDAPDF
jgi:hypothetical protein